MYQDNKEELKMINNIFYGLDIAKMVFHVFTINKDEIVKKQLSRSQLLKYFAQQARGVVGIEACGSAHHWARELEKLGYQVKLLDAKHVKAYLKGNKNDFNDAEAIYDAVTQVNCREVGKKTIEQQDIQLIHSFRQELMKHKKALVNQIRAHLRERGIIISVGVSKFHQQLPELLENETNYLSQISIRSIRAHYEQVKQLELLIRENDLEIEQLCRANELSQRLVEIQGIGVMTATILVSDIGKSRTYNKSRDYAASLGLVPRQYSTGGKPRLLGISKRGNAYIRTLLVHGARAVLKNIKDKKDKLSCWCRALIERRGFNVAAVALANKNARIVWAMATYGTNYEKP